MDGTTDDTAALVAAMAALPAAGGLVVVPAGTLVHTGIVLQNGMWLRGAGMYATVLKLKDASNVDAVKNYVSPDGVIANALGCGMTDLTVDCNKTGQSVSHHGVVFDTYPASTNATNDAHFDAHFFLTNVLIKNAYTDGFVASGRGGSTYYNVYVQSNGRYGFVVGKDSFYDSCQAESSGIAGFNVPTGAVALNHCKAFNCGAAVNNTTGIGFLINSPAGGGITITGCSAQNNRGPGYSIVGTSLVIGKGNIADGNNLGAGNASTRFAGVELSNVSYSSLEFVSASASNQGGTNIGNQANALRILGGSVNNDILLTHTGTANLGAAVSSDSVLTGNRVNVIESGSLVAAFEIADPNRLTVGEPAFARDLITTDLQSVSQRLHLTYWTARKTETITQVRTITSNIAAGATPTLCRVGIYSIDAAGAGTLVASTTNDTTLWAATGTAYTKALTASFTKTAGQRYATGILLVTAAAAPTFVASLKDVTGTRAEAALDPRLAASLSGQADLPASFTNAGVATAANRAYSVLVP